ncbi:MAG: GNAT family N-acetyltransferase [Verrucomicrobiota bacterium]
MFSTAEPLRNPPDGLSFGQVRLQFVRIVPGSVSRGFVPSYHFRIIVADGTDVGHINFRVGETEHVRLCAGHVGYEITATFRGHGFALQACRALAPFVRSFYKSVILTSNPDNSASIRTIEQLGAHFIDEVVVPPHDPHYQSGSRSKKRYQWTP